MCKSDSMQRAVISFWSRWISDVVNVNPSPYRSETSPVMVWVKLPAHGLGANLNRLRGLVQPMGKCEKGIRPWRDASSSYSCTIGTTDWPIARWGPFSSIYSDAHM